MSHDKEEKMLDEVDKLKQHIEGKEIIFMTEVLEKRRQAAEKVEEARKKANQDYQAEIKKLQEEREKILLSAKVYFKKLLDETEKAEEEVLLRIKDNYDQNEKEVIQNLIKLILP